MLAKLSFLILSLALALSIACADTPPTSTSIPTPTPSATVVNPCAPEPLNYAVKMTAIRGGVEVHTGMALLGENGEEYVLVNDAGETTRESIVVYNPPRTLGDTQPAHTRTTYTKEVTEEGELSEWTVEEYEVPATGATGRFCGWSLADLRDITGEGTEVIDGRLTTKHQAIWEFDRNPQEVSPFDQIFMFWVDQDGLLIQEESRYLDRRDSVSRSYYHGWDETNVIEAPIPAPTPFPTATLR